MLVQTLYDAYIRRYLEGVPLPDFSALDFIKQPYHYRVWLAGYGVKLKPCTKGVNITCCRPLDNYSTGVLYELPDIHFSHYEKHNLVNDAVYLLGLDGEYYQLFPIEYQLVPL